MTTECRICKEEHDNDDNPLISPCRCTGSIANVHRKCIDRWVATSNSVKCNVCSQDLSFRDECTGSIPKSLVNHIMFRTGIIRTLVTFGLIGLVSWSTIADIAGGLINHFVFDAMTFSKMSQYYLISGLFYTSIGFTVGMLRQFNFQIGQRRIRLDGDALILPISNILSLLEYCLANHHTRYTGWTFPVMLMYYHSIFKLANTVLVDDFLGWYQQHYIRRIFINRE